MPYQPEAIRQAYDEIAAREDDYEKGQALRNEIPREFIKKHLRPSDVVLDAGGGTGLNAIMMAQRCAYVTLLDLSPGILEVAARNIDSAGLAAKIDLVEGDITDLRAFPDAAFSFVVCVGGSLSYVQEAGSQAVRELVRVAKSGAILIVGCDAKYGFVRWLLSEGHFEDALSAYEASQYEAGEGAFGQLYTVAELTNLLMEAGCDVLEIAATPMLVNTWEQNDYSAGQWQALKELELKVCALPELLGVGHHLIGVARKR
jgi:ubiquinone/menaquinone biosynthesis C-methylase UbiE